MKNLFLKFTSFEILISILILKSSFPSKPININLLNELVLSDTKKSSIFAILPILSLILGLTFFIWSGDITSIETSLEIIFLHELLHH